MKLSTIFVIIIGIFYIALSIAAIVYFNKSTLFQSIPFSQKFQIAIYVIFGVFILITLLGMVGKLLQLGAVKRSKILLVLYFIFSLLIFILVLGVGIASLVIGPKIFGEGVNCDKSNGSLNGWVLQINKLVNFSAGIYGRTQNCTIYTDLNQLTFQQYNQMSVLDNRKTVNSSESNSVTKVQDCPYFKNRSDINQQIQIVTILLERVFNCSRWCRTENASLYFLFNDINTAGIPENKQGCYIALRQFVELWARNFGIILICISVVLLLNVVFLGRHCSKDQNIISV